MKLSQILLFLFLFCFGAAFLVYFYMVLSFHDFKFSFLLILCVPLVLFAGVGPIYIAIKYLISIIKKEE